MKEETKEKFELLNKRFKDIQYLENRIRDLSREVSDVDLFDPTHTKSYSLSVKGDYKYDQIKGRSLIGQEQNLIVPKELGDEFLEKLLAWKRRQLAQLEEKANNILVFDPTTIYQG